MIMTEKIGLENQTYFWLYHLLFNVTLNQLFNFLESEFSYLKYEDNDD